MIPHQLDRFQQGYAAEKARIEAHKQGYTLTEQLLSCCSWTVVRIGGDKKGRAAPISASLTGRTGSGSFAVVRPRD